MSEPPFPLDPLATPSAGRGSGLSPQNRFLPIVVVPDPEYFEDQPEERPGETSPRTRFLADASQSVVSENDSPDVPFRYSLNPYRGCEHGCAYCYARPYHEYLGFNAGVDFETQLLVKERAPKLFRAFLNKPGWRGEPITFSGVTDCYQPAERRFRLTRGCLEVAWEARQPIAIITKNALVVRDLDLLSAMARHNLVEVSISLTTLDRDFARVLEPRTSTPEARLRAINELSAAGVRVRVLTAPILPGLNDSEIPALLEAAAKAGARWASYTLLRLPLSVEPVFRDWLHRHCPTQAPRVEALIRQTREGQFNDPRFGSRMKGTGLFADQIAQTFKVFSKRHGLTNPREPLDSSQFRPPRDPHGQLRLFD